MTTNDKSRHGDTGTYLSHTHDDAGGRFAAVNKSEVVGQSPAIAAAYPAASSALQVELPPEPPLGFDNPDLESPASPPVSAGDTGDPAAHAPSSGSRSPAPSASGDSVSERAAGSSPSKTDQGENR